MTGAPLSTPLAARARAAFDGVRAAAVARPELSLAVLLFMVAALVRWPGVSQGLPYAAHPDEAQLLHRGIHMLKTGDFNPHYFNYPTFPMYVHAVLAATGILQLITDGSIKNLQEIETMLDTGLRGQRVPELLLERARIVSLLLGSMGVAGVGVFAYRLFNWRIGLLAGLATAFTVIHISSVRYVTTDAFAACFVPWAAAAAVDLVRRNRLGDYAFAGLLVGLAAAAKYNAAAILVVPLAAHALRGEWPRGHVGPMILLFGATGLTFAVVNPYALMDAPTFLTGVGAELRHYAVGDAFGPANVTAGLPHAIRILGYAASTLGLFVWAPLAALAVLAAARHERRSWILLLAYPVVGLWLLAGQSVFFPRNLILVFPAIGTLAALAVDELYVRASRVSGDLRRAAYAALALVCAAPVLTSLSWVANEAAPPESRSLVVAHARSNLPAGSLVAVPKEMDLDVRAWRADRDGPSRVIEVSLRDLTIAGLRKLGVTHLVASDRFGHGSGFPGLTARKVEFLNEAFALLTPLRMYGAGPFHVGQNMFAPRLGLYALDDPDAVAKVDEILERSAIDPVGGFLVNAGFEDEVIGTEPPGWRLATTDANTRLEKLPTGGVAYRIDATPITDTTIVCMEGDVAIEGPVVVRGRWKAQGLAPGMRAQIRYFTSAPVASIREVAWVTNSEWTDFAGVAEVPAGTRRAKVCFLVQGTSGTAWLDDLYFGPATEADIAAAQPKSLSTTGPSLPDPWIPVPSTLTIEGRAGPIDGEPGAFHVTGPLVGEAMACDNTPRPAGRRVRLDAVVDVTGLAPNTNPMLLPRLQVRGMGVPGGAAVTVLDTIVPVENGVGLTLNGEVDLPSNAPFYKVCVLVRTRDTRLVVHSITSSASG